ncbi:hypothetical protein [Jeotgalibacillus terrae]|uniref:Uncharacterized protein n=1 Tax=Jeotgalibacillus terrae TaxID=587735 RepID=A0ABW5ZEK6_9BACL|nr:hypothetical protein [Jeotgalibacillus terrae]MBM7580036.1 hypothetical protein [Jeotgalibacillus terrae]
MKVEVLNLKKETNSDLLIKYGEWYAKYQNTSSEKKQQEYLSILFQYTREILNRMDGENSVAEKHTDGV